MRTLFVATVDPSGRSGHNISTREIIYALAENSRSELDVICPSPDEAGFFNTKQAEKIREKVFLSPKKQFSVWWNLKLQFEMVFAFRKMIKKNRPDLVVTRMGNCLTLPIMVFLYGIPYYILIRGVASRDIRLLSGIPGLQFITKLIILLNCRVARQVIVAYQEVKDDVKGYRKKSQTEPVIFTNAVRADLFPLINLDEARKQIGLNREKQTFIIGFAGSIKKRHCLEVLVDAVRTLVDEKINIKVLIVGEGPGLAALKSYVEENGLKDAFIFSGFVEHENVNLYMAASDILYGVLDPNEVENPIKCYEYLAAGRPIITSRKEEFEFVETHNFGVVVESPDQVQVADAIRCFQGMDQSERTQMGEAGRQYVLQHHTWDKLAELIYNDFNGHDIKSLTQV